MWCRIFECVDRATIDLAARRKRKSIKDDEAARHAAFRKVADRKPAQPFRIDQATVAGCVRDEHRFALRVSAHDDG